MVATPIPNSCTRSTMPSPRRVDGSARPAGLGRSAHHRQLLGRASGQPARRNRDRFGRRANSCRPSCPRAPSTQLSGFDAARYVQHPLRVNRLPPTEAAGFGPDRRRRGELTNAAAWQQAGITGNVKVGIIDFFDLVRVEHRTSTARCPTLRISSVPTAPRGCAHRAARSTRRWATATASPWPRSSKTWLPRAELFLATTANTAETQAAIDWFALNGVHILDAFARRAVRRSGRRHRPARRRRRLRRGARRSPGSTPAATTPRSAMAVSPRASMPRGYVDFDDRARSRHHACASIPRRLASPSTAFAGRTTGTCRPSAVTDYSVEIWEGTSEDVAEPLGHVGRAADRRGSAAGGGRRQLRGARLGNRCSSGSTPTPTTRHRHPTRSRWRRSTERSKPGRQSAAFSAAKPVVDSRNPALGRGRSRRPGQRFRVASPSTRRRAPPTTGGSSPTFRRHRASAARSIRRLLQRHQRCVADRCGHGRAAPRPGVGGTGHAAGGVDQAPRARSRPAGRRQRLWHRGGPAPGALPTAVSSAPSTFTALARARSPARHRDRRRSPGRPT